MTGALWKSAFVAALFALHPLHVELVAWIAERKDLLSAFFFLLALPAYERYARKPGPWSYLRVALFALGLLSKPMVVTLPLFFFCSISGCSAASRRDSRKLRPYRKTAGKKVLLLIRANRVLFLEKIPLLVLSIVSCIVTVAAQRSAMRRSRRFLSTPAFSMQSGSRGICLPLFCPGRSCRVVF